VETWKGYSISYDAVTTFLEEHGYALSNTINPSDFIWKDIVGEIRQQLEQEHISSSGLASLLGYPKLDATRRKGGLIPSFRFGNRGGGDWFRRSDVAEWLKRNAGYMTQEARREFGMLEVRESRMTRIQCVVCGREIITRHHDAKTCCVRCAEKIKEQEHE
jgi:hypothetical protein